MKQNLSNLSKSFGINHLADVAKELAKTDLPDYQKCILLFKAQSLLESSRQVKRSAQTGEMLSLVSFSGQAQGYSSGYKVCIYMQVVGLYLNGIKEHNIKFITGEYNKLKRCQERKFSKTYKAIQELLEKDPYQNNYSQSEIILQNTTKIVSQRLRSKFRLKLFKGSDDIFGMCKFIWNYAKPDYKNFVRKGEIVPQKAFRDLKSSIEFPMTVEEFRRLIEEKKNPQPKLKVHVPVRCLFRMGRIELNWKQKRRVIGE